MNYELSEIYVQMTNKKLPFDKSSSSVEQQGSPRRAFSKFVLLALCKLLCILVVLFNSCSLSLRTPF